MIRLQKKLKIYKKNVNYLVWSIKIKYVHKRSAIFSFDFSPFRLLFLHERVSGWGQRIGQRALSLLISFPLVSGWLLQSVIISREGMILTLSILPCPQGRICWSTPCRKNDDKRRSFLHQNRYNLAKGHKFTWPIPLFEDCLAQSSRNQNQAFRYRKWIEVVLYIFRSHDSSLLWIWMNTNALVVDLFPN